MRKLLVLAALGVGLSVIGGASTAKAGWGPGPVVYEYDDCGYGYGGLYTRNVYVEPVYPAPVYVGPDYRRFTAYGARFGYWGNRYDVRYRGRYGRLGYRGRYRFRGRY